MGVEVYKAAKRKGEFLLVDRAGHNDIAEIAGEDYWRWIIEALNSGSSPQPTAGKPTASGR
jgi:fermentation-respiration switch protein FrsA (DUF1100 family)